jgi:hypothetical protein
MLKLKRISKREARKHFAEGKGFILCPCNMMPGQSFDMGYYLSPEAIAEHKEQADDLYAPKGDRPAGSLWLGNINDTAWELMYDNWAFYNTSNECGYYAHFYIATT